ncbi:MAG: transposase [Bacteroidales bacterium]|nr:transposase [Bacteroidales bacterium]
MAGTYSQIYIQVVFAVQGRDNLLQQPWREEIFKYMSGIIKGKNQKPIIVNGVSNHVHLLIGLRPSMALSDLVRDVKNNTSNFINDKKIVRGKFSWQEGFGSFSYAHSQIGLVYQYILHQEEHHRKKTFREEYIEFLKKFEMKNNVTPSGFMKLLPRFVL